MAVMAPSLVVIDQFNVDGIVALEPEYDPPVGSHRHRLESLQVPLQRVQSITRKIKSLWGLRGIQNGQDLLNGAHQIRPNPPVLPEFIKPFETTVLEAPDQQHSL